MALKHTDAALKKYPNNQLLRALRAFTLQQLGRTDEALDVLTRVVKEGPESERVLHTMTFTYKAAGRPQDMLQAYIKAAEHRPADTEILIGLFTAYGRELDFVKQQQISLRLSKVDPRSGDQYGCWAIGCMVLQARGAFESGASSQAEQLMKLATSMLDRHVGRFHHGSIRSFELLMLYVDLLHGQGNTADSIAVLEKFRGDNLSGDEAGSISHQKEKSHKTEILHLLASSYVRRGDLRAAANIYKTQCISHPDDWWSWKLYLDCVLPSHDRCAGEEACDALPSLSGLRPKTIVPGASSSRQSRKSTTLAFPVGIVGGLASIWDHRNLSCTKDCGESSEEASAEAEATLALMTTNAKAHTDSTAATAASGDGKLKGRGIVINTLELALRRARSLEEKEEAVARALPSLCSSFSCISDLRMFLREIDFGSKDAALRFIQTARRICLMETKELNADAISKLDDDDDTSTGMRKGIALGTVRGLQCFVNSVALSDEIVTPIYSDCRKAFDRSIGLVRVYADHLHLSKDLDPRDRGFGIELIALAASTLICTWQSRNLHLKHIPSSRVYTGLKDVDGCGHIKESERGYEEDSALPLLAAYLALEASQVRRTVAAPLRLSSCALCGLLGASKLSSDHFKSLDIKNVQHDSLTGHWLFPLLLGAGEDLSEETSQWIQGLQQLHQQQSTEAKEALVTAFEQGAYSKIHEFVDFIERLQRSRTRAAGQAESSLVRCRHRIIKGNAVETSKARKVSPKNLPLSSNSDAREAAELCSSSAETITEDSVCFNDDLTQRPVWFPPRHDVPEFGSNSVVAWWLPNKEWHQAYVKHSRGGMDFVPGCSQRWWTFKEEDLRPAFCHPQDDDRGLLAQMWKQNQLLGLRHRCMIPNLIQSLCQDSLVPSERCREFRDALDCGCSSLGENVDAAVQVLCDSRDDHRPDYGDAVAPYIPFTSMYVMQMLFRIGLDIHESLHLLSSGKESGAAKESGAIADSHFGGLVRAASARCARLDGLLNIVSNEISTLLAAERHQKSPYLILPDNCGAAMASGLLKEDAVWIGGSFPVWINMIEKNAKSLDEEERKTSLLVQLATTMKQTMKNLSNGVEKIRSALKSCLDMDVVALVDTSIERLQSIHEISQLWSYEEKFDPKISLRSLFEDQKATCMRLLEAAVSIREILA